MEQRESRRHEMRVLRPRRHDPVALPQTHDEERVDRLLEGVTARRRGVRGPAARPEEEELEVRVLSPTPVE